MNSFTELEVWKKAREFRSLANKLIKKLPKDEKFLLINQLIRSTRSITANIAEGHGRFHYQENIQFCRQARGSLTETLDHLIAAFDEGYISKEELVAFQTEYEQVIKLLNGYINYLRNQKKTNL